MSTQEIGVIGAGIVGLAVARQIGAIFDGARVTVLEKENRVAVHQSGHNSGVVHAGLYYPPGSLKASLCRRGASLLNEYCEQKQLAYDECGKLVVAIEDGERAALERIRQRAIANGVPDLRSLDAAGLREVEPHAVGVAALQSPHTAITDYVAVAMAFADDIRAAGGTIRFGFAVQGIRQRAGRVEVRGSTAGSTGISNTAGAEVVTFDRLVICAGLQSDQVARWAGDDAGPAIVPFRGEYFRLVPERTFLVRGLIYPVPDPDYPFLGVHFTKRVHGGVDVGPNAVLALAREGYRRTTVNPRELGQTLAWPGFRRLARRHWRMGVQELAGSISTSRYLRFARRYVPEVGPADVQRAQSGVRAQAVDADGGLVDDFRISQLGLITAVRNAPSPAATSSLAIAEYITAPLRAQFGTRTA